MSIEKDVERMFREDAEMQKKYHFVCGKTIMSLWFR